MKKITFLLIVAISLIRLSLFSQTFPVTNTSDFGPGSLRQAILDANAYSGTPTITFEIPSSSVITVISTELPNLNKAGLTVDGTMAPGYSYPNSMVTISWPSRDDCFHQYLDNVTIRGLTFTNNNSGTGDAAIRAWSGSNLLVEYCRAYNQNKKFVRTEGGTLVQVKNCTIENFANDGNAKVFEALGGGFLSISRCNITNIPSKFIEFISSGVVVTTIEDNVLTNVGYEDNSSGGGRGAHAIQTQNIATRLLIRNNTVNGCKSQFIHIERNNTGAMRKDSIYNNTILNCTGSQVIYMYGKASNDAYIGNNYIKGDGGIWQMDQAVFFNSLNRGIVKGNVFKNMKSKGIQFEASDNSFITGNIMYNLSGDCYLEINNDCDILTVRSNIMGTDSLSSPGLSIITGHGVKLNDCDDCTFGGDFTLGQGNQLIGGSTNKAMEILSSCTGVTKIQGNDINVSSDGLTNLSTTTGENIIHIMTNGVVVGGDINLYRNRISGTQRGIQTSNSTTIQGNYIGCTRFGSPINGSAMQTGIEVQANSVTIGSKTDPNLKNKIGYCEIAIRNDNKQNVLWSGNEFFNNTDSRVLYNNGDGANNGILKPVITGGTLPNTVFGTSRANARVEVYHWNPSKPAQGYQYLGFATANGSGAWTFTSPIAFNDQVAALQFDGTYASEFASYSGFAIQSPTANSDNSSANTIGTNVVVNILSNDLLSNGSPATAAQVSVDLDLVTSGVQASLTVVGQGIWVYNGSTGELTFDPQTGFGGDPAIIQYQLIDNSTGYSDIAVVWVGFTKVPPVANNDVSNGNSPGVNVVVNVLSNDLLADGSLATPANVIVDINLAVVGIQTSRTILGIGVWTYNPTTGELTFDPQAGYISSPPVLNYSLKEIASGLSDIASVTVSYLVATPVANNDVSSGNYFGSDAVVPILANDQLSDGSVPSAALVTIDIDQTTAGIQTELTVSGEGVWSYQLGYLTFDPLPGLITDPSVITYTLTENSNGLSDNATVTINYVANPALNPPLNLEAGVLNNNDVQLTWETPAGFEGEYLHWDNGINYDGIGLTEGGTFSVASRWKPEQLAGYDGQSLTNVRIFPRGNAQTSFTLKVWSGVTGSTVLTTQTLSNLTQNQWNTITLVNPVVIDANTDLWVGYTVTNHAAGLYPAGCDAGPAQPGYGDMIRIDGVTWVDLKDIGYNYNWNIQAGIEASFDGKTPALPLAEELTPETNASSHLSRSFIVVDGGQRSPEDVTGYNIFKDNTFLTTIPGTETSWFDNDLANGIYSYKVTAVYAQGESASAGPVVVNIPGGAGPSISVGSAAISEIHTFPPLITTVPLGITNTGSSMLDINIEALSPAKDRMVRLQNPTDGNAMPKAIKPGRKSGKWETVLFGTKNISPNQKAQQVIRYDDGSNYGALGTGSPGAFEAAIYFPASVMQPYTRMILKQVEMFIFQIPTRIKVKIYGEGTSSIPGQLIYEQVVSNSLKVYSWNTVDLGEGVEITGDDLWISYEIVHTGQYAPGIDNGPVIAGYGDWLRDAEEGVWVRMSTYGFSFNWNLAGILFDESANTEWLSILPVQTSIGPGETANIDLTFNSDGLTGTFYEALLQISSNDPVHPVVDVPVTLTLVGCTEPTNLAATSVTKTSANLTWTPGGIENAWEFVFGESPLPVPTGQGIPTASNSDNSITGLYTNTSYQFYVRSVCGEQFSPWAGPFTFTTACDNTVAPFAEGFEDATFPPTCWSSEIITGGFNWERSTAASGYGNGAASALANFFNQVEGSYNLFTLGFDASLLASPVLRFDYAYATYSGEVDQLNIYYSVDGGLNYFLLMEMPGGESGILNTGGSVLDEFIPAADQWATQSLELPEGTNMIKFEAISAYGNNLYLDNVRVFEPNFGVLEGYVYEYGTTIPIDGASISLLTYNTTTNAEGYYNFPEVAPGSYDITASAPGFISQTITGVTIETDVTTLQNFALTWINFGVNPSVFTQTLEPCAVASQVMQISNEGGTAPFNWSASVPYPSWISVEPATGTVLPGETVEVNVNFDATGLQEGIYDVDIEITYNGQSNSDETVVIPVSLTVLATLPPQIPTDPIPAMNATSVPLQPVLSWKNGVGTTSVKLIITKVVGGFSQTVYESGWFAGNSINLATIPVTLEALKLHSWKVTAMNPIGQIVGPIWKFTTKGTGTISGIVTQSYNGLPVSGVTITANEVRYSAITGPDGTYSIPKVQEGIYTLTASHPDYNPEPPVQVTVVVNQTVTANFVLDLYLNPPTGLQAGIFNINNVNLTWIQPPRANRTLLSYNVYRNDVLLTNTTFTTINDLNLAAGTYNYYVVAVYQEGLSDPSDIVSVVILPAPVLVSAIPDQNGVALTWTEGSSIAETGKTTDYSLLSNSLPSWISDNAIESLIETTTPEESSGRAIGDNCNNPILIGTLPYTNVNTTCGRGNDYSQTCLGDQDNSEDIVYKFVLTEVTALEFVISSTFAWSGMLLTQDCPIGNNCIVSATGGAITKTMSTIVDAGTYFLMIDSFSSCISQFTLNVNSSEVCQVDCPSGAIPEGEPCGENLNDGCNDPVNVPTTLISCGDIICGKAWANGGYRDTDWYELVIDSPKTISWTVTGEFPAQIYIIDGNAGCSGLTILSSASSPACEPAIATAAVQAGTYWLWVGSQFFDGYPCGLFNDYVAGLTCENAYPYFTVYRDGAEIASVYDMNYYDTDVNQGETYCYTVSQALAQGLVTPESNELCAPVPFVAGTQNIILQQGWSGWSSNITPFATTPFVDVITPVINNVVISQYFGNLYWPLYNINTMGNFTNTHGYLSKMSNLSMLNITGNIIGSTVVINAGWNLLPVLSTCNVDASELYNIPGFIIAWEVGGNSIFYPGGEIYTLNSLNPGKAYWVKTDQTGDYTYPNCGTDKGYSFDKPLRTENHTSWNDITYTGLSHGVIFDRQASSFLNNGDIIGAFTQDGICAGMTEVVEDQTAVSLYADDITTEEVDGFTDGQVIIYRLLSASTGEEYYMDVTYDHRFAESDGRFVTNGLSVINHFTLKSTGIDTPGLNGITIYPNPSSGVITISGLEPGTSIIISDTKGQLVCNESNILQRNYQFDLSGVRPGVYFVNIQTDGNHIFRKLIIQ